MPALRDQPLTNVGSISTHVSASLSASCHSISFW